MSVAVVTGAGRGIGRALAEGLVSAGWSVAAIVRDPLVTAGTRTYVADVTDPERLGAAFVAILADFGSPDLVVANAGVFTAAGPTWTIDPDRWWSEVTTNLRGAMLTATLAVPAMLAGPGGRIVLVSSGIGNNPSPYATAYGASKAAVTQFAASLDRELADTAVRVFAISPGMVRTDLTDWPPEYLAHRPELADLPESAYLSVDRALALVGSIGRGELDDLRGRYLHSTDDLAAVRAGVAADPAGRVRRLGLIGYGPTDPLGS